MKMIKTSWAILLVICIMAQLFVAIPSAATAADLAKVTVEKLQVEYQTNPLGMDNAAPRFSWTLKSDERGVLQESYRIVVADSEDKLDEGPYPCYVLRMRLR